MWAPFPGPKSVGCMSCWLSLFVLCRETEKWYQNGIFLGGVRERDSVLLLYRCVMFSICGERQTPGKAKRAALVQKVTWSGSSVTSSLCDLPDNLETAVAVLSCFAVCHISIWFSPVRVYLASCKGARNILNCSAWKICTRWAGLQKQGQVSFSCICTTCTSAGCPGTLCNSCLWWLRAW